jgi:hypothetical protein
MTEIPQKEPSEVVAGDTIKWTRKNLSGDYPANDGWTLQYRIFGRKGNYTVDASADGAHFAITIAAADSAAYVAGDYTIRGFVSKAGERYQVYESRLKVEPDPTNVGSESIDERTHAKKCLEAIEAVLEGRATRSDRAYTIAGRQTEHYTFEDLLKLRDYYAGKVAAEEREAATNRGESGGQVLVRFSRPS